MPAAKMPDGDSAEISAEFSGGESGEWTPHLEELRRRLIAVLVVFTIVSAVAFAFSGRIAAFLMAGAAGLNIPLYTFAPAEKFSAYLHLAIWTGAIAAAPFCLAQIVFFIWPALRGAERRWTSAALIVCPLLFFSGAALSYKFLVPAALRFFANFASYDDVRVLWSFKEYLSILYSLAVAAGLLLQTPLVLLICFALGIITPRGAARARPFIILGIFLLSALCTPPDVVSQIALAVPLTLIFELTLFLGRVFTRAKKISAAQIDLQWFAAEDEGRTEEPTERKIQRAREEGRVVKSRELTGAVGLLLPALSLLFFAPYLLRTFAEMAQFFLTRSAELDPVHDKVVFGVVITYIIKLALPVLAVALAAGLFSNIVQVGFLWTTKPLEFKPDRIVPNFAQYFSKTLFSANGVFNLFLSIAKMAIIGITAYIIISGDIHKLASLQNAALDFSFKTISTLAIKLVIVVSLLLLLLSIPDYMFQRWQFRESMRMTTQEVKEERKESEGDPQIKARLRARMRELMRQKIAEVVPKADVVITNPTHYAVALEYNISLTGPRVLAKGEDELALRIKRIAAENDVPVVENKPLARALYAEVDIGEIVPEHHFALIAEILTRVKGIDYWRSKMNG